MLRDRGLRRTRPEQTAESLLRGAHASAVLEDSTVSMEDFREGNFDETAEASARLSAELLSQVPVFKSSPVQALARLHALAGMGIVAEKSLGRPVSTDASQRLQVLGRALSETTQPALLAAALAHAEVRTMAPFASHNGLVARAFERLILVARGVDPASLVVPEAGHLALRPEYESNLRAYRNGGRQGLHAWLLYAAEAFAAGAEASPLQS